MKTDKIKKIIIFLCIILIIIIISILILIFTNWRNREDTDYNEAKETTEYIDKYGIEPIPEEDGKVINNIVQRNDFMIVKNCMQGFLNTININSSAYFTVQNGKEVRLFTEDEIESQVYGLLSNNYTKNNNINKNAVFDYVEKLEEKPLFIPLEIKKVDNNNLKTFIVHGIIENSDYKVLKELYSIVNIDKNNNTYSIEPLNKNYENIKDIEIKNLEENITRNDLNTYVDPTSTTEDMIRLYLDIYKKLTLGLPELSYEYLNDEYKTKRFGSLEEYKKYVENNKDYIKGLSATQYKSTETGSNTEYVIMDNKNNYIIINEKSTLNFEVILDSYTINISEISEKYNNASDSEKVGINIEKFIQMINRRDYKTSYNILADSFKNNKFKTQYEFERYVKNKFFEYNELEISEIKDNGTYFTCQANLINKNGSESKEISFVMQLKEGTDFVMSFSIE